MKSTALQLTLRRMHEALTAPKRRGGLPIAKAGEGLKLHRARGAALAISRAYRPAVKSAGLLP